MLNESHHRLGEMITDVSEGTPRPPTKTGARNADDHNLRLEINAG